MTVRELYELMQYYYYWPWISAPASSILTTLGSLSLTGDATFFGVDGGSETNPNNI